MYAFGMLGDGERKSAEPIAARTCADPEQTKRTQDKLLHFLGRAVWDDRAVRLEAVRYAVEVYPYGIASPKQSCSASRDREPSLV